MSKFPTVAVGNSMERFSKPIKKVYLKSAFEYSVYSFILGVIVGVFITKFF
jgi:hypothetical protein